MNNFPKNVNVESYRGIKRKWVWLTSSTFLTEGIILFLIHNVK